MIDRVIGLSAGGCLGLALMLFLSRLFGIVTPNSRAYTPVLGAFFWVFGLAIILGNVFLVRQFSPLTQARRPGLRWLFRMGTFLALLIPRAMLLMTLCVGMNFMGQ